jgi:ATP-binding cassette subfamily F protein uup
MSNRVLLSLEDVSYSIGNKMLFDGLDIHVVEGDKICLVGRNGVGKTTLMRLLTENLELDSGTRFELPGVRIGYLPQQVNFDADMAVVDFVQLGLPPMERGEESAYKALMVLAPLDLDSEAPMGHLSGGQVRRAALAQSLVAEPDVLLLDEPTNHLDLGAIEWLEGFLARTPSAVICVSHDRTFLSQFTQKVFWIDQQNVRVCPKGYAGFDAWQEEIMAQEARTLANMQKKLELEEAWRHGGVSARRKRNQRRMNELFRLREKLRNDKEALNLKSAKIETDPLAATNSSKLVAEFKHVDKAFQRDGKKITIMKDFSMKIVKGDRIGILGRNGSGKSTFLKLLIDELQPDAGRIFRSKKMELAYFDQHREALDPTKSLWRTLAPNSDYVFFGSGETQRHKHVAAYLKDFMFDPKAAKDLVGTLSGGMQNRLMLAKTLINPGNLMVLDEPTNDLDMDTLDMLQGILADYAGTLIIVSHDRDFLDRTVTEVLAFEGEGNITSYWGGYSDYIRATTKQEAKTATKTPKGKKQQKKLQNPAALTFTEAHELSELPDKLEALEKDIDALTQEMESPALYMENPKRFDEIMQRMPVLQQQLETMEARWVALEEKRSSGDS